MCKKVFISLFSIALFLISSPNLVFASPDQAYKDYLYQFDLYRATYTEFKLAKNEYDKFKNLGSEQKALDKTKLMLAQRDQLLRAYLLVLNENLQIDTGLPQIKKQLYQTLIANENVFFDKHSKLVESVGSIEDAVNVSGELQSHYAILQTSMRQTILAILMGKLINQEKQLDIVIQASKGLLSQNRFLYPQVTLDILDRWWLQITNKRALYQQKVDDIETSTAQFRYNGSDDRNESFLGLVKKIAEAKQYLQETTNYLQELTGLMKYVD